MNTFSVRLTEPADHFAYFDHTEERAGDVPHEITEKWSEHPLEDLERVISMLTLTWHPFEIKGLSWVEDPIRGGQWTVNP